MLFDSLSRLLVMPVFISVLLVSASLQAAQKDPLTRLAAIQNASLLLEEGGRTVASKQPYRPMIPASTLKLVTALAALDKWGEAHRFTTDFYLQGQTLWIKGGGDPFLISEEIDLIVSALQKQGVEQLDAIATDATLFEANLKIDGRTTSHNPYDAPVSALAANFNSVGYKKSSAGVVSSEAQTPMTPLGEQVVRRYKKKYGTGRVSLDKQENGPKYFAEVLASKLRLQGVAVADRISSGKLPGGLKRIYRHRNSHSLGEIIAAMLEHSSNFIANSLFLMMATGQEPLNMSIARARMESWIDKRFGWKKYAVIDGAGLSRGNRLSAVQLMDVVKAFTPYRKLLPDYKGRVMAKTGTLRGVSCYAGFIRRDGDWQPFSLMINQPIEYYFRVEVADALSSRRRLPTSLCGEGC